MEVSDNPPALLIVVIPTFDLTGYMPLVCQLYQTAIYLNRSIMPIIPDRLGVWNSMNDAMKLVEDSLKPREHRFRGMHVGSDTHIENPDILARYIGQADEEHFNFVCNMQRRGGKMLVESLPVKDLSVVDVDGYGLYYGDMFTDYTYHTDGVLGDDGWFLKDNKLTVRLAMDVKLRHYLRVFT